MATKWSGNLGLGGGIYVQLGLVTTVSPSSVSTSTSSVTVSWSLRLRMVSATYANGNDSWSVSGSDSGSGVKSWNLSSKGDEAVIASGSQAVTLQYGSTQTFTLTGQMTDLGPSSTDGSVTVTETIPARPYSTPAALTNFAVARVSDSTQRLTWTRNATASAPYEDIEIGRRSLADTTWRTIATISGSLSSYDDTSTAVDNEYEYRARPVNSASAGGYAPSRKIDTTPKAPGAPKAAKQSNGDILVTRPALSPHATQWELWHAAGGAWDSTRLAIIAAGTTTYAHTAPDPTVTHQYRIKAVTDSPVLSSTNSGPSNVIQLQAAPKAPTSLTPTGACDATEENTLWWKHNPVDTTLQTAYEINYRPAGSTGAYTTTGKINSTRSGRVFPANTWTNGSSIEWRVRTWGAHADPSPWSNPSILQLSARPVASITSPDSTWGGSYLTVSWSYYHDQGTEQAAWLIRLWRGPEVIETKTGTGPATTATFDSRVEDGASYTVDVELTSGHGLVSKKVSRLVSVTYELPPKPTFTALFHPAEGYTEVTVDVADPSASEVAATGLSVERWEDGRWVTVATGLEAGSTIIDRLPKLGQLVDYRVTATSSLPSTRESDVLAVSTNTRYAFFNFGPGLDRTVRIWGNLTAGMQHQRARQLENFTDRELPVMFTGRARTRTYELTGRIFAPFLPPDPTSQWSEFFELADTAEAVVFRDPEGVKMFCSVSGVPVSGHLTPERTVTISMTQVDGAEA